MNESEMETLLRKAPRLKPPEGLLEALQRDIALNPQTVSTGGFPTNWMSLWKRWLPATVYGLCVIVCAATVQMQFGKIKQLREENSRLKETVKNLDQLRAANVEYQKLSGENQQLARLQKENEEVRALRAEVTLLHEQLQTAEAVHSENQQLRAATSEPAEEEDFLANAQKTAESNKCVNNLRRINLAARIWSNNHKGDFFPKDFVSMTNELETPKILICPCDKARAGEQIDVTWEDVKRGAVSYQMVSPGGSTSKPGQVYVKCPFHNHIALIDGSVQGSLWTNHFELDDDNVLRTKQTK